VHTVCLHQVRLREDIVVVTALGDDKERRMRATAISVDALGVEDDEKVLARSAAATFAVVYYFCRRHI
jgi:hypothetical protein